MPTELTKADQEKLVAELGNALINRPAKMGPGIILEPKLGPPPTPTAKGPLIKPTTPGKVEDEPYDPNTFFIPKGVRISQRVDSRIAIIGGPGSGKTTSCMTFPNRIWYDIDHKCPSGEQTIDIWDSVFCDSIAKRVSGNIVNRRDAFKFHLRANHHKFHPDQTLITDSWTMLMNAFDAVTGAEDDLMDLNDKSNKYWLHKQRLRYCIDIFEMLKACRCRVVVTMHETPDRDSEGDLNGKIRPLMDGKFKDQLLGQFTDAWRQRSNIFETEPNGQIKRGTDGKKILKKINYKGNPNWVWFWQLLGDVDFDTNCNPDLGAAVRKHGKYLVPADFDAIQELYKLS